MTPRDVLALQPTPTPRGSGVTGDDPGHVLHRDVDPLFTQRRDRPVGDAARNDVLAQVAHVGGDVEGKAVHGSTAGQPNTDGGDLARHRAVGVDPDAGVVTQPPGVREPELAEAVDDHLLDRADVRDGVGEPAATRPMLRRQGQDRIADELAGSVVRHVAAPVHADERGADGSRVDQDVGLEVGPRPVREHVGVLEQQQVLLVPVGEERLLQPERLGIADAPEPPHPQRPGRSGHSSADQSRLSSTCLIFTRKPAA